MEKKQVVIIILGFVACVISLQAFLMQDFQTVLYPSVQWFLGFSFALMLVQGVLAIKKKKLRLSCFLVLATCIIGGVLFQTGRIIFF